MGRPLQAWNSKHKFEKKQWTCWVERTAEGVPSDWKGVIKERVMEDEDSRSGLSAGRCPNQILLPTMMFAIQLEHDPLFLFDLQ